MSPTKKKTVKATAVKKAASKGKAVKKVPAKKSTAKRSTRVPSQTEIQQKAFELYQQRGGKHGHDLEDWLQAESELVKN